MKPIKTMRMLLGKTSTASARQTKPKKTHRPLKAVLAGAAVGFLLDLQESKWKNDLWKPKG